MELFVYEKSLGWTHDNKDQPVVIYLLTVRFLDHAIPGGSLLRGYVDTRKQTVVPFERYCPGFSYPPAHIPEVTHQDLVALAHAIEKDLRSEDPESMPEPHMHHKQGSPHYLVADTLEDAVKFAFEAGFRVKPDFQYGSRRDLNPRGPWIGLREYQKRQ